MQKLKNILLSIFFFFVFCILGIIGGIGVGYGILILDANGMFSSWEPLNGNLQIEKIVGANSHEVWVRATDQKVYSWNTNCYRENCNQWIEAEEAPEDSYGSMDTLEIGASCKTDYFFAKEPRGNIIECARVEERFSDLWGNTYYALLDNGKLLMWKHSSNSIVFEVMPFVSAPWGLVAGVLAFLFFTVRRSRKNKNRSTSTV